MTETVYLAYCCFLAAALYRRPQRINIALGLVFLATVLAAQYRDHDALRAVLAAIDAGLSATMAYLWRTYRSERAWTVGWIAVFQVIWSICAGIIGVEWNTYAAVLNASCFVQVFVAGGFSDGLFAWLGRGAWRARSSTGFGMGHGGVK